MSVATKNVGLINSAILTFIGHRNPDKEVFMIYFNRITMNASEESFNSNNRYRIIYLSQISSSSRKRLACEPCFAWRLNSSHKNQPTQPRTFLWFSTVPKSKFEANWSRSLWVMIRYPIKQTEITTLYIETISMKSFK